MISVCKDFPLPLLPEGTFYFSYAAVAFGADRSSSGARITQGKKRLQQALRENDMIMSSGRADQRKAGAQILDVNVGVPAWTSRPAPGTAERLQSVTPLPLQLTLHPAAWRRYAPIQRSPRQFLTANGRAGGVLPCEKIRGGLSASLVEKGIPRPEGTSGHARAL